MLKFEIVADSASELKKELEGLTNVFNLGSAPAIEITETLSEVELETVEAELDTEVSVKESNVFDVEAESIEEDKPEEDATENIAEKMTYWKVDGEYGNSRKGEVIPDEAKVFSSKAIWASAKEEEESNVKTNYVHDDGEPDATLPELQKLMGDVMAKAPQEKTALVGLLARFEVKKLGQLPEENYNEFKVGLETLLRGVI